MINKKTILKRSDWVKGKARNGELIIGFVDSMSYIEEAVYVTVVESDNEDIIGETIPLTIRQVENIPTATTKDAEQLEFLIDLALETGDQEWFNELSVELNAKRHSVTL